METISIPDSLQFSKAPLGCLFVLRSPSTSSIFCVRCSSACATKLNRIPVWISVVSESASSKCFNFLQYFLASVFPTGAKIHIYYYF